MINTCQIVIVTGLYAGSICKNVHSTCPHQRTLSCKYSECNFKTKDRIEYKKHLQTHQSSAKSGENLLISATPTSLEDIKESVQLIPFNFYEYLEVRYGKTDTVDKLASMAMSGDPLTIVKEFSEDYPHKNMPIASYNGHYRFIYNGVLVDTTIHVITKLLTNKIQNAMIIASNELIKRYRASLDTLYNSYDIGKIQSTIANFPSNKIKKGLDEITECHSHIFFKNGMYAKRLKRI